jgi:hypothetical protein
LDALSDHKSPGFAVNSISLLIHQIVDDIPATQQDNNTDKVTEELLDVFSRGGILQIFPFDGRWVISSNDFQQVHVAFIIFH